MDEEFTLDNQSKISRDEHKKIIYNPLSNSMRKSKVIILKDGRKVFTMAEDFEENNIAKETIQPPPKDTNQTLFFCIMNNEPNFISNFLFYFRYLMKPMDLFQFLLTEYTQNYILDSHDYLKRIIFIMQKWVKEHWYDFEEDDRLMKEMNRFISQYALIYLPIKKIQNSMLKKSTEIHIERIGPTPPNIEINIAELDSILLANQLTLITFESFRLIRPDELYFQKWTRENKDIVAPHVNAMINKFNHFSFWIATEIVMRENIIDRIKVLKLFICTAYWAYGYRDYETTFMISQALYQAGVSRLHCTWDQLDEETKLKWNTIQHFTCVFKNYSNYRNHLKRIYRCSNSHLNILPYFSIFLKDLTVLEESTKMNQLHHLHNIEFIGSIIQTLQRAQKSIFNFKRKNDLITYLLYHTKISDEDGIYTQSALREPKLESRSSLRLNGIVNRSRSLTPIPIVTQNPVFGISFVKEK